MELVEFVTRFDAQCNEILRVAIHVPYDVPTNSSCLANRSA